MHDSEAALTGLDLDDGAFPPLLAEFYRRVRADALLGPVFNDAVDDWDEHLDRLAAFWSSVMLTSGRYKGNPMATHLMLADRLHPSLFERWLDLWKHTTDELLKRDAAAAMQAKAARISESLQLAIAYRRPNGAGHPLHRSH